MSYDFPRRSRVDLMTPAELAISNAVVAVEAAGADPLLTDAVNLLHQAQSRVADFVDRKPTSKETSDLIDIINSRIIGVDPDDRDVTLEDHEWRWIVAALEATKGA